MIVVEGKRGSDNRWRKFGDGARSSSIRERSAKERERVGQDEWKGGRGLETG